MNASVQSADGGATWLGARFFLWHVLVPVVLAYVLVVMVPPIGWAAGLLWSALLVISIRRYERRGQPRGALCAIALEAVIVVAIVVWAIAAPGKIKDEVLDRPVRLPKAEMTLAELKQLAEENPHWQSFPTHVSVQLRGIDASTDVHFRGRAMSLREFVADVESQTPLRHRFGSCGNGYTILGGEDCCFGMNLRDPTK